MIFIDEPQNASLGNYNRSVMKMVEKLKAVSGVLAIYQIGGFGAPGISDIDMVVVFEDGATYAHDPREDQSEISRYLFTHQLFASSLSLFKESQIYTFFHNFKLLHGKDLRETLPKNDTEQDKEMKRQLAREYLVRMLANMTVEREYGIYKVRNLLLHGNGLTYDLEFLGENPERLKACLDRIMEWRSIWFEARPSNKEVSALFSELWASLVEFLNDYLHREPLLLPPPSTYKLGHNIALLHSERICSGSKGPKLKWAPKRFARKIIGLQHRLNQFEVGVPICNKSIPAHVLKSFEYTKSAWAYNRHHLPYFMPLTSSLVLSE